MSKVKILIVDDDLAIHDLIHALLKGGGCEFEQALNTQDALMKFADFQPDLVFLDINMPGANGFVALRRLRALAQDHNRNCKIVMLTGNKTKEDVSTALAYGADDFLAKPINRQILQQKLVRHFPGVALA
ncbi:MAG: response regulator [Leptospirales bacterium]|jgi:CheY-like chemotaxis protein